MCAKVCWSSLFSDRLDGAQCFGVTLQLTLMNVMFLQLCKQYFSHVETFVLSLWEVWGYLGWLFFSAIQWADITVVLALESSRTPIGRLKGVSMYVPIGCSMFLKDVSINGISMYVLKILCMFPDVKQLS